jgi:hypothetical protein
VPDCAPESFRIRRLAGDPTHRERRHITPASTARTRAGLGITICPTSSRHPGSRQSTSAWSPRLEQADPYSISAAVAVPRRGLPGGQLIASGGPGCPRLDWMRRSGLSFKGLPSSMPRDDPRIRAVRARWLSRGLPRTRCTSRTMTRRGPAMGRSRSLPRSPAADPGPCHRPPASSSPGPARPFGAAPRLGDLVAVGATAPCRCRRVLKQLGNVSRETLSQRGG